MKICRGEILQYIIAGVLIFLPLVANMTISSNDTPWEYDMLVFSGLLALLFAGMVYVRLSRWWLTPLVLVSLVYSCFVWRTGFDVGYHAISAMYETTFQEAFEFLKSPIISSGLIFFVVLFILSLYLLHCKWNRKWAVKPVFVSRKILVTLAVLGGVFLTTWKVCGNDFSDVYPVKLICQNIDYYTEVHVVRKEYKKVQHVYQGDPVNSQAETYILIIGESARSMNWGLYGYDRDTTPVVRRWLDCHTNSSVLFSRPVASGRVTRVVVPSLLSVVNASEYPNFYKHPSFIRVFRDAGFKTFTVSAQPSTGYYEGLPNMMLGDSEVVMHLDQMGIYDPFDEQLFDVVENFLADPAPKKLIVMQLQGSHLEYAKRYPKTFDKFKGRGKQVDTYDNSILYTDWVIGQIFEMAERLEEPAFVFYTSDHGENLNDSGDGNFSHGVREITKYEINIPMVCCFNGKFVRQRPKEVQAVLERKDVLITHDMLAHTFMGLAGLNDPGAYQPEYDLSSERFNPGEMYFADNLREITPLKDLLEAVGSDSNIRHAGIACPQPALR